MTRSPAEQALPSPGPVGNVDPADWNGLCREPGPFVDWRFLAALEQTGSVGDSSGWRPLAMVETDQEQRLICAAPAFLKFHSHGEFVFDWNWAHAAQSAGIRWFPKLLVAAPFTPVTGPRLLGGDQHPEAGQKLIRQMEQIVETHRLSSAGVNFCDTSDARLLDEAGWLERHDWQFHWQNHEYRGFDDFLERLKHKPRKNIRAERRRVREAGWRFNWCSGHELDDADLDLVDRCYQSTFALYGNLPMLNRAFFAECAREFADQFLVCRAMLDDKPLAASVFWRDDQRLYGRYWGSLVETRDVHFEACYYQGIDYCIRNKLKWFEPGAQGEHKIRRGFLPTRTRSFHYIRHPGLREGIRQWLKREAAALDGYRQHLDRLDPYRR